MAWYRRFWNVLRPGRMQSDLERELSFHVVERAEELQQLPQTIPPPVDAGLPVALLARRPDLRATELRLRERLAQVDQARLSFYPVLSLTGSLGNSSAALNNLFQHPIGSLGAQLAEQRRLADEGLRRLGRAEGIA